MGMAYDWGIPINEFTETEDRNFMYASWRIATRRFLANMVNSSGRNLIIFLKSELSYYNKLFLNLLPVAPASYSSSILASH